MAVTAESVLTVYALGNSQSRVLARSKASPRRAAKALVGYSSYSPGNNQNDSKFK